MSDQVISVKDLTRRFGDFVAVDHVNFEIARGEVVGYLGPNGSGKTTTIRMLLGLLRPTEGKATVLGHDAFLESGVVRSRAGYMSQKFALYDDLTVLENLVFYGGVYGISSRQRIQATVTQVGLTGHEASLTRSLSAGWRQRLALAIALVHQPELLFLDEPTSGVDPTARRAFWDLIYDLTDAGVTILVTTHYMDEAEYCERVGIMRDGRLLALDTPSALKQAVVPGNVWELFVEPLQDGLVLLNRRDGVLRVSLAGDHIRIIAEDNLTKPQLRAWLVEGGLRVLKVEAGEPTLEDVFLTLSK
jgi:drug efflux transport system ATP-binding protein